MTQTWWLSFVDPNSPEGERFLGVAIVDVTEADVEWARPTATAIRASHNLPPLAADSDDAWMASAIRKAHATGCNPGGEVGAVRLDDEPTFLWMEERRMLPRDRLLSKAELTALGHL